MDLNKFIIFFICTGAMFISTMTASAESDSKDDVLHWKGNDWRNWNWNIDNKPNIDIIDISYSTGEQLTISMSVAGIISTELALYDLEFSTGDADYHVIYNPDSGIDPVVTAFPQDFSSEDLMTWEQPDSETSINGGTITATIDWATDDHTMSEFYGWAEQWNTDVDKVSEAWWDYAPDDQSPYGVYSDYYGNGGSSGGSGTPGFETFAVIAAIGIVLILFKRKNSNF